MRLEGLHHITMITGDARRNVDFYADDEQPAWQQRIRAAGAYVTPVRDRDYFRSICFREPRGVLFEIATLSPGFTVDEPAETLGESLRLPKQHEHLRPRLESTLTPVESPRRVAA